MRKILLVSLGGTVGYVLGARAGRPAYDRIMKRWTGFAGALGFQQLAATAAEAGVDVRDSAVSRFSSAVSTSADSIVEHIEPDSGAAATTPNPGSLTEQGTALDPGVRR
jgi:hypothetical protein